MKLKEFIQLICLNFIVSFKNSIEELKTWKKYYNNQSFRLADLSLKYAYFFKSPFKVSKDFLKSKGEEEIHIYGETPLATFEKIIQMIDLKPGDLFIDLGCGAGRASFWTHSFTQASVLGIDHNPEFINTACEIVNKLGFSNINFENKDLNEVDFSEAQGVYLYGTCFSDHFILSLLEHMKKLPCKARVVTVSYPLTDYTQESLFQLETTAILPFTWGKAKVYLQRKL